MSEVLHGNAGGDLLKVTADKSQVYGLQGNDTLISDGKSDALLVGGSGDDSLIVKGGTATLNGGDGSDTFELNYSAAQPLTAVIEDLDPASDRIFLNFVGNTVPQLNAATDEFGNLIWRDSDGLLTLVLRGVRENDYFDGAASDEVWDVLQLTNAERENYNLPAFTLSQGLTAAAAVRAQEITELGSKGVLTNHTRRDGTNFDTVLDINSRYAHLDENLDAGAASPTRVVRDWMNSTAHRAHILTGGYHKLGVGYNYYDQDPKDYRYYWTQIFADNLTSAETVTAEQLLSANIALGAAEKFMPLTEGDDTYGNTNYGATIAALGGNDFIVNAGLITSISGGAGNDVIENGGTFTTINAGTGDDQISLNSAAQGNLIEYAVGDGNDVVIGFGEDDTLSVSGAVPTYVWDGNDLMVNIADTGSVRLVNAANIPAINISGSENKIVFLSTGDDRHTNSSWHSQIESFDGNDFIYNDTRGDYVTINTGAGNDTIVNYGEHVSINGGDGNDSLHVSSVDYVTVEGGTGDDTIENFADDALLSGGEGNDSILSYDDNVTILGGNGDDTIENTSTSTHVTIDAGAGNDSIDNGGDSASINGGDGNDTIDIRMGSDTTIDGGAGNDRISLGSYSRKNTLIEFAPGSGNDSVIGLTSTDTVSISGAQYVRSTIVNDIVLAVGEDSLTILNAASLGSMNILGEGSEGISVSGDIELTDDIDVYSNPYRGASIYAKDGDDYIVNSGDNASIDAGAGNDIIISSGDNVSIDGRMDNDLISLSADAQNVVVGYTAYLNYQGDDTVIGFNETDTLRLSSVWYYSKQIIGNDILVNVNSGSSGAGSILLAGAAALPAVNIQVRWSEAAPEDGVIALSNDNDYLSNGLSSVAILAQGGDDSIWNYGDGVIIDGGAGDEYVRNEGNSMIVFGGAGDDSVYSYGTDITVDGGEGNDNVYIWSNTVRNTVTGEYETIKPENISINGGAGNDNISSRGSNVTIYGGEGNDTISENGTNATIDGGAGDDSIHVTYTTATNAETRELETILPENVSLNAGDGNDSVYTSSLVSSTIDLGAGDNTISAYYSTNVTILSGDGNDSIHTGLETSNVIINSSGGDDTIENGDSDSVTIDSGAGNDSIESRGTNISISTGDGDDTVYTWGTDTVTSNVTITTGAGNDSISNSSDSVTIDAGAGDDIIRLASYSKNNLIRYTVGDGNDTLYGWAYGADATINISGSTWTSVVSGDDIVLQVGDGSITLKDARDKPTHIVLGESGGSGGGSGGDGGSADGGGGSGTDGGIGGDDGNSTDGNDSSSGNDSGGNGYINLPDVLARLVRAVYSGGDDTISNYESGDKILFSANHDSLSYVYDDEDKLTVEVPAGKLVIENAVDKVVDLRDRVANPFLLSYAATDPGTIDGRGIDSFEVFQGSDLGSDEIFAGNDGSNLWGGGGNYSDLLHGGDGADAFFTGKNEGNDAIQNASPADTINLYDTNLSDIVATSSDGNVVGIQFNTGNVITAQSTDTLSAQFNFADGSSRRYNHETKSWQAT